MKLRGWGNAFAAAGLILAIGVAIAQAPQGNTRYLIGIGVAAICAVAAITLLRPKPDEQSAKRLAYLRQHTSARRVARLGKSKHPLSVAH